MNPKLVFLILAIMGLVWTGVWLWLLRGSRQSVPYSEVAPRAAALRTRLFYLFLAIAVIVFLVSMRSLPYASARANSIGEPEVSVTVNSEQWVWTFSETELPVGVPVEFVVTSADVNHGFAIFSPQGQLLTQVQAMPGYTNHLIYEFAEPGTYTIRCLELCGIGHHGMVTTLTVE